MKGLVLAKKYYEEYAPCLCREFPQLEGRMAFGLVGEGSQCFGFDDEISCDHDFEPGFCIWLSEGDYQSCGKELQAVYDSLPKNYEGFGSGVVTAEGSDRLGVFSVEGFFEKFLGTGKLPETAFQWLLLPEGSLAACTNGQIWKDPLGEFTAFRNGLLHFYPEDALRKKIAARAAVMSQAGQYNLLRAIKRNDRVSAALSAARFTEASLSMMHLLNRRYMPFYKWAFRSAQSLPILSNCCNYIAHLCEIPGLMAQESTDKTFDLALGLTETICADVAAELRKQNFSREKSTFLQDHLADIMSGIKDPEIASLPPMADFTGV